MNYLKYPVCFLFISIFWLACSDDDISELCPSPVTPTPACTENAGTFVENFDTTIVTPCITMVDYVPINRYDYIDPVFNPNDENEIIYIRKDYEQGGKREIWKYNFCTNETSFVTDEAFYGIDWSGKDWVIFTGFDQQLYKIKSDGDSLTQLTNNPFYNSNAKWNSEGTAYLYRKSTSPQIGLLIGNELGEIQDTLHTLVGATTWTWDNDRIFYTFSNTYSTVGEYNLSEDERNDLFSFPIGGFGQGIGNIVFKESTNSLYWKNVEHIARFNIETAETYYLTQGADNRLYGQYDITQTGNNVIFSRGNLTKINDCTVETEAKLYLVDITGEQEREVEIPE